MAQSNLTDNAKMGRRRKKKRKEFSLEKRRKIQQSFSRVGERPIEPERKEGRADYQTQYFGEKREF